MKCNWVYNIYVWFFSWCLFNTCLRIYSDIRIWIWQPYQTAFGQAKACKTIIWHDGIQIPGKWRPGFFSGRCMFSFVFVMLKKGKCSTHSTFQGCFLYALSNAFYRFLSSNVDVSYRKKQKDHQTNVIHLSGISWHRQVYQSCGWTSRGHWRLDCQSWCAWNETNWNKPHFQISKDVRLQNMMHIMLLYISSVYRHMFLYSQ